MAIPVLSTLLGAAVVLLVACSSSHFEPAEVPGPPALVDDAGTPRLWVLTKQEEVRQVGVGGGSRSRMDWRRDTFFHFGVQTFDQPELAALRRAFAARDVHVTARSLAGG